LCAWAKGKNTNNSHVSAQPSSFREWHHCFHFCANDFYPTQKMNVDTKYKPILLEALEDMMYKLSLQLDALKGEPLTTERKALTKKQELIEELQHLISASS
jgi:hypothetical protein